MRIESAMLAGREGLIAHGQAIAVIGDNVSNSNTVGYKASRIEFADLLSEGQDGRQSESEPMGGSGVMVSGVRQIFEGGLIEDTSRDLDAAIDGDGFFMVGDVEDPLYSRAGNFSINSEGLLVNSEGQTVLGLAPGSTTLSTINMYGVNTNGIATSQAALVGNVEATLETTYVVSNPQTFSEIAANASYMTSLTVYDTLGAAHDITLAFFKTGTNSWTAQSYIDGADVGGTEGVPVQVGQNASLTFDTNGAIDPSSTSTISATPAYSDGAAAGNFTIDLSKFTQFASPAGLSSVSCLLYTSEAETVLSIA